ncbi:hypothetical protein EJ110_NYTH52233, partial [Nymphaea thermarum]
VAFPQGRNSICCFLFYRNFVRSVGGSRSSTAGTMAIPSSSLIGSSSFPSFLSSSSSCIGSSVAWVAAPCPSGPPLVSSSPRESGSFLCARPSRSFCHGGLNLRGKGKWKRIPAMADSDSQGVAPLPRELAVLLEIEGVLVDFYHSGNRQAFNEAFQKLGLDCANWTDPIYIDLARKSGGDDERMLILFFNKVSVFLFLMNGIC